MSGKKNLAVDANIARSAGRVSDAPISTCCRKALMAIRKYGHKVIMNEDLQREWMKHGSAFAIDWLSVMQQEGRVVRMTEAAFAVIRRSIEQLPVETEGRNAVLKDFHLISAALRYDRLLLSNDAALRGYLLMYAVAHVPLQKLAWIYPTDELLFGWLAKPQALCDAWILGA